MDNDSSVGQDMQMQVRSRGDAEASERDKEQQYGYAGPAVAHLITSAGFAVRPVNEIDFHFHHERCDNQLNPTMQILFVIFFT
jgi:hypothetical protein